MPAWKITKFHIATFIALLFHVSGYIGMFTDRYAWFVANTPLNLLLMFGLVIWTQTKINRAFILFAVTCFVTGMVTEMIGVNTGILFGNYEYGKVLGPGVKSVPYLIGINWFVVIYCSGVAINHLHTWVETRSATAGSFLTDRIRLISFVVDGALLATVFDYVLEPVAVKLGYWSWLGDGSIPFLNYLCWFFISGFLLIVFKLLSFPRHNQFAVHLLIIELLFFIALRTFL